jgi:glutamine amidotransferase
VTLVDYELNNLFSVSRALEQMGARIVVAQGPAEILAAERLVLPGVGSFKDGMARLERLGLVPAIREYATSGRPLIGLCLGMQLLAEEGEEFGLHKGLGLVRGRVVRFPTSTAAKIPHIGWNSLQPGLGAPGGAWQGSLLGGVAPGADVYFVHSYFLETDTKEHVLALTEYGGVSFPAVVAAGNIYGCQFHPEKSGLTGLRIIENFAFRV